MQLPIKPNKAGWRTGRKVILRKGENYREAKDVRMLPKGFYSFFFFFKPINTASCQPLLPVGLLPQGYSFLYFLAAGEWKDFYFLPRKEKKKRKEIPSLKA